MIIKKVLYTHKQISINEHLFTAVKLDNKDGGTKSTLLIIIKDNRIDMEFNTLNHFFTFNEVIYQEEGRNISEYEVYMNNMYIAYVMLNKMGVPLTLQRMNEEYGEYYETNAKQIEHKLNIFNRQKKLKRVIDIIQRLPVGNRY